MEVEEGDDKRKKKWCFTRIVQIELKLLCGNKSGLKCKVGYICNIILIFF